MRSSRPAFCKGVPRSRAFRMQRDLRTHPRPRAYPYDTSRQVLNSILTLLQKTSTSVDKKLGEVFEHLKSMPPWTEWSPHADAVVSATLQNLHKQADVTADDRKELFEEDLSNAELVLASELIRLNGNVPYLDYKVFKDASEDLGLAFVAWLHHIADTEDPECHVRNEQGTWVTNTDLRDILLGGGRLHIPSRTVLEETRVKPE